MNPALGARIILLLSWTQQMTNWNPKAPDVISSATPLIFLKKVRKYGGVSKPAYINFFRACCWLNR